MKKNHKNNNGFDDHKDEHDAEILKAVAQAWHGHSTSTKAATTVSESDASRRFFKGKPTRFKVEKAKRSSYQRESCGSWDFRESLWDSYEIVAVSKKLERSLVMGDDEVVGGRRRRRESSNSLRSLFNRVSSRRFTEDDDLPPVEGDDHEYDQD